MGATVLETSWRHVEDLDLLRVRNNRRGRYRSCGALREIDEATVRHRRSGRAATWEAARH